MGSCVSSTALAIEAFDGVQIQTIIVEGKSYEVPVGNEERKNDIYYLKKAMKHDQEALDMFLGGEPSRLFYIGKEEPLWIDVDDAFNFKIIDVRDKNE